jgi:hypothetical protein
MIDGLRPSAIAERFPECGKSRHFLSTAAFSLDSSATAE